jgi:hypothetical protein
MSELGNGLRYLRTVINQSDGINDVTKDQLLRIIKNIFQNNKAKGRL